MSNSIDLDVLADILSNESSIIDPDDVDALMGTIRRAAEYQRVLSLSPTPKLYGRPDPESYADRAQYIIDLDHYESRD